MTFINDGTGGGYAAKVTSDNHLHVAAETIDADQQSVLNGRGYNFNTGTISLTSANESAIQYLKSDGTAVAGVGTDLLIPSVIYILGATNGSGVWTLKTYRNPTAGTLISGGSAGSVINRNFSSNASFDGTALVGAEGSTITTHEGVAVQTITSSTSRTIVSVSIGMSKGSSLGISVQPPPGATASTVQVALPILTVNLGTLL